MGGESCPPLLKGDDMNLKCELKSVGSRKEVSGDMIYKIVLATHNPMCLDLGKLPADSLFDVVIGLEKGE